MTPNGTNAKAIRLALVTLLDTELDGDARVAYSAPDNPEELQTDAGLYDAIWTGYRSAVIDTPVFAAGTLTIDEQPLTLDVIIQVMRFDGTPQADVDDRAEELLGAVLGIIRNDPDLGIADTEGRQLFHVVPTRWDVSETDNGLIGDREGVRGARFRVQIAAHSRLNLDLT